LRLLRPIRVLVVSRDDRYVSVCRFLLARKRFTVTATRRQQKLLARVEDGVDVVVLDASYSLAEAAQAIAELEALRPEVGVVVVSERVPNVGSVLRTLPKWESPQRLADEICRAYLHRHRHGGMDTGSGPRRPRSLETPAVERP
jgi:CheY-like chemotaxis protein